MADFQQQQRRRFLLLRSVTATRNSRKMSNGLKIAAVGPVTAGQLGRPSGQRLTSCPMPLRGSNWRAGPGRFGAASGCCCRGPGSAGRRRWHYLREQGAIVDDVAIYDTVAARPPAEALAEVERGLAAITFASPSSVRNFLKVTAAIAMATAGRGLYACGLHRAEQRLRRRPSTVFKVECRGRTIHQRRPDRRAGSVFSEVEKHHD